MIEKKLIKKLKKEHFKQEKDRRQIISLSNQILFEAKKTIFAIQREDRGQAEEKIKIMTKKLKVMEKKFGHQRLQTEGAYQAASEEYLEALSFKKIIDNKKIKIINELKLNHYSYLGGICDLIGEMVRYATNQAAKGNSKIVPQLKSQAEDIMSELLDFDFTGYLRTKYDQARGHLRKLEQINYDLKLRDKK